MELRCSIRLYVAALVRSWRGLALGGVSAALGVVHVAAPSAHVPVWLPLAGFVAAALIAPFPAFHALRLERDRLLSRTADPLFLQRLGLVNRLSGRFDLTSYAPAVSSPRCGLAVRAVIAAEHPAPNARLDSALARRLRETMVDSAIEGWLRRLTPADHGASDAEPLWRVTSPGGGMMVNLRRRPVCLANGVSVRSKCLLQLPHGLFSGPWLLFLVDVVYEASDETAAEVLELRGLHELGEQLLATAIDDVAAALFDDLVAQRRLAGLRSLRPWRRPRARLLGPNLEVLAVGAEIPAYVGFPASPRADGAYDHVTFRLQAPEEGFDARERAQREGLLRDGFRRLLEQHDYLDADELVEDVLRDDPAPYAAPTGYRK